MVGWGSGAIRAWPMRMDKKTERPAMAEVEHEHRPRHSASAPEC